MNTPDPNLEQLARDTFYRNRLKPTASASTPLPPNAYVVALDIRKFEIELYWKRAAYFWVFTGAALAAYLAALTGRDVENRPLALLLTSCIGLVFASAWYLVNRASKYWQLNWEFHVDLLEKDQVGDLYKTVIEVETRSFWPLSGPYPYSVSKVNQWLSLFVAVAFLLLAIYTLINYYYVNPAGSFFPLVIIAVTLVALWILFFKSTVSDEPSKVTVKPRTTTITKAPPSPR